MPRKSLRKKPNFVNISAKNILACESRDQVLLIHEKNQRSKISCYSHEPAPLKLLQIITDSPQEMSVGKGKDFTILNSSSHNPTHVFTVIPLSQSSAYLRVRHIAFACSKESPTKITTNKCPVLRRASASIGRQCHEIQVSSGFHPIKPNLGPDCEAIGVHSLIL